MPKSQYQQDLSVVLLRTGHPAMSSHNLSSRQSQSEENFSHPQESARLRKEHLLGDSLGVQAFSSLFLQEQRTRTTMTKLPCLGYLFYARHCPESPHQDKDSINGWLHSLHRRSEELRPREVTCPRPHTQ